VSLFFSEHVKHDPDLEAPSGLDSEEKQNMSPSLDLRKQRTDKTALEKPKIVASCEGIGKRKRGRPAGTSMEKGKTTTAQARRTRARIGQRPAKICDNESDESVSHDEKTQREEIKIREGNPEMVGKGSSEFQGTEVVEDSESSPRGKAVEQEVEKDIIGCEEWHDKVPKVEMTKMHNNSNDSERPEKLEVMTDPVQAMLLDMIPSLGVKEIRVRERILKDDKPPPSDSNAEPSKKKKVSYKDVAGELLKDW
jgi:DNA ligase-4